MKIDKGWHQLQTLGGCCWKFELACFSICQFSFCCNRPSSDDWWRLASVADFSQLGALLSQPGLIIQPCSNFTSASPLHPYNFRGQYKTRISFCQGSLKCRCAVFFGSQRGIQTFATKSAIFFKILRQNRVIFYCLATKQLYLAPSFSWSAHKALASAAIALWAINCPFF